MKNDLLKTSPKIHRVNFGSEVILFSLEFRERKSLAISVHPDLSVSVTAPNDQPLAKISAKVKKRAPWILRQKYYFSKFLPKQPPRKYVSGETHKYLGKQYRLKIIASLKERVTLKRGFILVSTPVRKDSRAVRSLLTGWYREQADKHFAESLARSLMLFRKFHLDSPSIRLKKMSKRWGSCTSNGIIYLNPDLIRAPKKCIDYVMVHELCHLKIRDHSTAYYRLLKKVLPDWGRKKGIIGEIINMSLLKEYIDKGLSVPVLETELLSLIGKYNKLRGTYLFVYSAAIEKQLPQLSLDQSDYYTIMDLLKTKEARKNLDFYLETPGGSGETAEEIVRFLRSKYESVSFVVAGEAKSAGTIIVMSGDEILMTDSASLGPIDAQVRVGRSVVSAHDYMEWVRDKRKEAGKQKALNPFDAVMVAQISPGELLQVDNALRFAQDLVKEWLPKYKFRNWTETEERKKTVTEQMRKRRALEIAKDLTNHSRWRSHGRSLKISDLDDIGLKVRRVDDDETLRDIVYRIHVVCRLLFESSSIFKIFATADEKIFRLAQRGPSGMTPQMPNFKELEGVHLDVTCEKCGKIHKLFIQFQKNDKAAEEFKRAGMKNFPSNGIMRCDCGFQIDLTGIKNNLEAQSGRQILTEGTDKSDNQEAK